MCHLNNNARKGPATKLCCLCQLTLLVVNKYPRKPNWPKLRNYAIRSNLFKQTANTVHLQWPISIFYSFDKTRLSYGTPPWCSTTVFIETYPPLLQVMFCVLVCTLPVTLVAPHHRGGSVFLPVTCVILVLPHPYFMKSLHIWLGFTHKIIHSQLYFFCMFCKLWNIGEFSKHPLLYVPTLLMHIHARTDWKMQVKNLEEN